MLVIEGEYGSVSYRAVRVRDGRTITLTREKLQHSGLMEYIEESQGDE
jgi:hypothetical protein